MELDIQNFQDVVAERLSGGQKRKLTFGIAILGDPQVREKISWRLIWVAGSKIHMKVQTLF